MDAAKLSELYREALAVRDETVRAALAGAVAQSAAATNALNTARPPELGERATRSGDHVRLAQLLLALRGHDVRVDGEFDSDTAEAVRKLQQSAGLDASGVVDDATWSAMAGGPGAALAAQAMATSESVQRAVASLLASKTDGAAESATAVSIAAEAATAETLAAEALAAEPVAAEPLSAEPLTAEPLIAEPIAAEPIAAEPVLAEPIAAEPIAAEPIAAEPIAAEPVVGEPVAVEAALSTALNAFISEHGTQA